MISPFIAFILDYQPAPGQFINEAPEIASGASGTEVLQAVADQLVGDRTPGIVSLGAFGGNLTFAFDHPVANVPGETDFAIYGNAISNNSEPGVVLVSQDLNGNGLPDDPWYELAGSEESNPQTRFEYSVTYRRPSSEDNQRPMDSWRFVTDAEYIPWSDSLGGSGFIMKISEHLQSYWPQWLPEDTDELTFTGTLLPPCGFPQNDKGTNWGCTAPAWGYADAVPNHQADRWFDISNAVDSERNPVRLAYADFFRVRTSTNEFRGWLGEASTEICGAEDLHPDAPVDYSSVELPASASARVALSGRSLSIESESPAAYRIVDASGKVVIAGTVEAGISVVDLSQLPKGIYFVICGNCVKFALSTR